MCARVCMDVNVPSEHSRGCCHKVLASRSLWVLQDKGREGKGRERRKLAFNEHLLYARYFACMSSHHPYRLGQGSLSLLYRGGN